MNDAARPIPIDTPPFYEDHHVNGIPVLPAVEAMEWLAVQAGRGSTDKFPLCLTQIRFDKFLQLDAVSPPQALARIDTGEDGSQVCTLTSRFKSPGAAITRTLSHTAFTMQKRPVKEPLPPLDELACLTGVVTRVDVNRIYREMVPFGPAYRNLRELLISPDGALARVGSPVPLDPRGSLCLGSPYVLDAAFHAACVWCQRYCNTVAFPVALARRDILQPTRLDAIYTARVIPVQTQKPPFVFDIFIVDDDGAVREAVLGITMRDVSGGRNLPPAGFYQPQGDAVLAGLDDLLDGWVLLERDAVAEFADQTLSQNEKARLLPMTPSRRQGYLSARLALKRLSRNLPGDADPRSPQDIETVAPDGQRPQCPQQPFCSVAHDKRFTVAVAAGSPVGVDVEPVSDKPLKAPEIYMSAGEQALVESSSLGRAQAALRVWSAKEAAAKAMGLDLADAWQQVQVTRIGNDNSSLTLNGDRTQIVRHAPVEDHLATLLVMENPA